MQTFALTMATYVLIHGAAHGARCWDLLAAQLRRCGHDVVAMDLPSDDEAAGLSRYADVVVGAIGDRTDLVVVAHSLGAGRTAAMCAVVPGLRRTMVPADSRSRWPRSRSSTVRSGDAPRR